MIVIMQRLIEYAALSREQQDASTSHLTC
jgi:hypothetical protein